ncbi:MULTISPECIES: MerR family transcriptional regulator [Streptomyces]|uniref:MerR family transcriptional regulator n=1 Tax=Streptomyces lycii TaxID=2654337 RepID=A0ABQ7FPH4_9ACTN|nr:MULTISPECIES: MerR family transcriptional regulator [Streptomyces]KAF4410829.1 MerR family transcriptional regulator [Streptomyces lycii]PGH50544.1 MerR family transcriptional regulator [Streptomyces sp. Ru87]
MFTIGDFARHGHVSVRMLRHYDAVGLLRPARVDPVSGYRLYTAGQLSRLNRVIALKDLGFTLQQVRSILDEEIGAGELRGMLRLRRAELEAAMAATAARLTQVEARLRTIESEGHMSTDDIVVKSIPAVRVAELSGTAANFGPEAIGPVVGPLFEELCRRLSAAGVAPAGPGIAYYDDHPDGERIRVHAAMPVRAEPDGVPGTEIVDLPAVRRAATVVHHGPMDHVLSTAQALARWIEDHGHRSAGYARELYLECPENRELWVTELQEPLRAPSAEDAADGNA